MINQEAQYRALIGRLEDLVGCIQRAGKSLAPYSLLTHTDDLAARQMAQEREVLLIGTVGILLALARDGSLSLAECNTMLAEMIERRYRSPVDRLDELI